MACKRRGRMTLPSRLAILRRQREAISLGTFLRTQPTWQSLGIP